MSHGTHDIHATSDSDAPFGERRIVEDSTQKQTAVEDNRKECPLAKPCNIQIKLCDNGWLVGVHTNGRMDYSCGPNKEFVFRTAHDLGRGIELVSQGRNPDDALARDAQARQVEKIIEFVNENHVALNVGIGDSVLQSVLNILSDIVRYREVPPRS